MTEGMSDCIGFLRAFAPSRENIVAEVKERPIELQRLGASRASALPVRGCRSKVDTMLEVGDIEFQGRAAELLAQVSAGEDVVVLRAGEPVAWLTRDPKGVQRREAVRRMIALRKRLPPVDPDAEPQSWEEFKAELRR